MNGITLTLASFFLAAFALFQFGQAEQAHAAVVEKNAQNSVPLETTSHGCGCGCSSCGIQQ